MTEKLTTRRCRRRGAIALAVLLLIIFVLLALAALAVDVGYVLLTQTQLQAAADSATLAGGTELMPGLSRFATKTPAEVEAAARPVAVQFAGFHRAGEQGSVFADPARDVAFGRAVFDNDTGEWVRQWGSEHAPYNMVTATLLRNQAGSPNGDRPLPLWFASLIGFPTQNVSVDATAVIMPARGFSVPPGSPDTSDIIPIAFRESVWDRLASWDDGAQYNYETYRALGDIPSLENDPGYNGVPMYYSQDIEANGDPKVDKDGNPVYVQDFFDNYHYDHSNGLVSEVPDGWLEVNIYPEDFRLITAGNAGTIDLGDTNNAASAIRDQVLYGLTASDYEAMGEQGMLTDGSLILDADTSPPTTFQASGDTGISGGPIDQAFNQIIGQSRVMLLFNEATTSGTGPGETIVYTLTRFVGIRIMFADLTTNNKVIWIQMAPHTDGTAIPDLDEDIGPETTVFTPLILIE
jgi:hypothetical protein